jgi:hypothetical protein
LLADYSELGQPLLADGSDVGVSCDKLHLPVPFVYDSKQSRMKGSFFMNAVFKSVFPLARANQKLPLWSDSFPH